MSDQALPASSRQAGVDLLIGACGFVTSLITALILWWVEGRFGFAFYTWTFWLVVPVGALLSGFAGASGYYAGSWLFDRRPTRQLLVNVVLASIATFLLIHYLSYVTLEVEGTPVSDFVSFWQYLDIAIRSTSMGFSVRTVEVGSTGELGDLGYLVALLQILGFAAGGFAVYAYLESQAYCEACSRYLTRKGRLMRYTADAEGLQASVAQIFDLVGAGSVVTAIETHKNFGSATHGKNDHLRSMFEVRHCKKCHQHWVKFSVEKQSGNDWKEISELSVSGFTQEVVSL